jgi:Purine catabolism regulatory protein-like family/PucR C-terminal helix-turn-helix domain/GGDEF-like domain
MGEPTGRCLRLADLLAEDAFRLELLSGGPEATAREVRGAHAVEVEEPARWLGHDWVMLTTGVRLRGNAHAQRALIPQLEAGGASALGFGVGLGFKRVPAALVDVAQEHGFPVFAVPYETPFREIIHFVDSAVTSGEEHVFRRLTALQRYLVDALRTPQPERAMVDRLARFLDASVVLMSAEGKPEVVAGKPPPDDLLREVCAEPPGLLELDVDGWHAVATPIVTRADEAARWLVLASPGLGFIGKLAKPAAEATAPLLAAMACLRDVVRDQELAVKAALLEEALAPAESRDLLPLTARAAAFGLDFSRPARLIVLRRHPRRADARAPLDVARVRRELISELEHAHLPHLVHAREESIDGLVQGGDEELRRAVTALSDSLPDLVIGIGRAVGAIAASHHSLRDAELAVDRGGLDPSRRIMRFEEFDLGTFALSEIPRERLGPKVDEILSVLRANPPLYEALSAYFAHDLDIAATAASLHMHRNSLRYRLARAEQLLGRSLKQPATIAAVYIALVAEAGEHVEAPKAVP